MRCYEKLAGGCALSFGAGVLFCCFLPACVMVCVTAVVIAGVGAFMLFG